MEKSTGDLLEELTENADLDKYINENEEIFVNTALSEILNGIVKEKNLTKSGVLKRAGINDIYGYQLFQGIRFPSRDKLIALCVGMELDVGETLSVMKASGIAPLYAKSKRDSIIISEINQGKSVFEINDTLYEYGEKTLE